MASPFTDEKDANKVLKPIMVKLDDQSQLAFEVERADAGMVVAYMPEAPDPRSGNVIYITSDRVEPLNITFKAARNSLTLLGQGSAAWFSNPQK